jgi:hypothetical protein
MKPSVLKRILFLFFMCCLSSVVCCQSTYWQQQVNYKIDVTLTDTDNTLDGFVKMDYHNNSPDTLYFIWIHLWPNAFKNDKTAFTDQDLENGSTDFYFSNADKRGYINRLDFKLIIRNTRISLNLFYPNPLRQIQLQKLKHPFM